MLSDDTASQLADDTRTALKMATDRVITCQTCASNDACDYSFDPYNTDGDCLAMK